MAAEDAGVAGFTGAAGVAAADPEAGDVAEGVADEPVGPHAVINRTLSDSLVAILEAPGLDKSHLDIQAKDNTIRISGKKAIAYPEGVSVHRRERSSGVFDRTLTVPMQINVDGIRAEYRDGVLALFIPRAESDKPRTVSIN